ncbi:MAG TPA: COX15/CtaA family protein, partial [Bacteroidia bacterium]|nr:COX15/CtaA family protein [Bacteroidia bacterium]
ADSVFYALNEYGWKALVDNMSGVQVVHRYLAYVVVFLIVGMVWFVRKKQNSDVPKLSNPQMNAISMVLFVVLIQFSLGVLTLVYNVPVSLGVIHQVGAFFLFASVIYLLHRLKRTSVAEARI